MRGFWVACLLLSSCARAAPEVTPPPAKAPAQAPITTSVPEPSASAAAAPAFDAKQAVAAALEGQPDSALVVLDAQGVLLASGGNGVSAAADAMRPGSTIKPLLAQIAAETGALKVDTQVDCQRDYKPIKGLHCFDKHGALDLPTALAVSCNSYFYRVAQELGYTRLHNGLSAYGFGRPSGLAEGEVSGTLPSEPTDNLKLAPLVGIGEGPMRATLLQLANAYAELAGKLTRPGASAVERKVLEGMVAAVQGDKGTAPGAAVEGLRVAGKTGTADADQGKSDGWFVGFAPASAPKLVVGVVQRGRSGREVAPIAGRVLASYRRAQPATPANAGE